MIKEDRISNLDYMDILDRISDRDIFAGEQEQSVVSEFESIHSIRLPSVYKDFIYKYGALHSRIGFDIFGLGCRKSISPSLYWAVKWLRFNCPDAPPDLMPISPLFEDKYTVINCSDGIDDPPVKIIDLRKPYKTQQDEDIFPSVSKFLKSIAFEIFVVDQALQRLIYHVDQIDREFQYDHTGKGKLPRNHDWRAHRICQRDIVLGVLVLRHVKGENCMEVDVFLPIDLPPFEPGGSLLFMTLFILADAYRCGSSMEIRFSKNVDGGQVPRKLVALAKAVGAEIKASSLGQCRLDPDDSSRLFIALSDFSPIIRELIDLRKLNPVKACYVIARGIWSKHEVEYLLHSYPQSLDIFSGGANIEQQLKFNRHLRHARSAVLFGRFNRALQRPHQENQNGEAIELEDYTRDIHVGFSSIPHIIQYRINPSPEEIEPVFRMPYLIDGHEPIQVIDFGTEFDLLIRARSPAEIKACVASDIAAASKNRKISGNPTYLLYPRDFLDPSLSQYRDEWISSARSNLIEILAFEESTSSLDNECLTRMENSRIVREL